MKPINEMSTPEMVAEYNALTGKAIKKFSSRPAGEEQLRKARLATGIVVANIPAETKINERACPQCERDDGNVSVAGPEGTPAGRRLHCFECDIEYYYGGKIHVKNENANQSRSEAIRKSWSVVETYEQRRLRDKVHVSYVAAGKPIEQTYKSVRAAFIDLELPLAKHIKFRMDLKASGSASFEGYNFKIVKN